MKIISSILFCLLTISGISQNSENIASALESKPDFSVKCELLQFNKQTQNGYTVFLNSTVSIAEKQWKQFIENQYAGITKKSKGAIVCENLTAKDICDAPLTISAFFNEDEDGCKMKVFYERGGSYIFDKENPKENQGVTNQLKLFLKKLYVVTYETVLAEQRKIQEEEGKSLEKLEKEGEKLDKEISKEEETVKKAEEEIIKSELEISELEAKIQELRAKIESSTALKEQLQTDKTKKTEEIVNQKGVVDTSAARIEKLKSSAEKLNY